MTEEEFGQYGKLVRDRFPDAVFDFSYTLFLPNEQNNSYGIVSGHGDTKEEALGNLWKELSDLAYDLCILAE